MIILQHKDESINEIITHSFQGDGLTITDLLEKFQAFVSGLGYYVHGEFIYKSNEEQEEDDAYYERRSALDDQKDEEISRLKIQIDELTDQLNNGNRIDLSEYDPFEPAIYWPCENDGCNCGVGPTDDSEEEEDLSEETKQQINDCLEAMKAKVEEDHEVKPRCF
jgi:hypothetical protein